MKYVLAYKSIAHGLWVKKYPDENSWRAAYDWATALRHHVDRVPESEVFMADENPDGSIVWITDKQLPKPLDLQLQITIGGLYVPDVVEKPSD